MLFVFARYFVLFSCDLRRQVNSFRASIAKDIPQNDENKTGNAQWVIRRTTKLPSLYANVLLSSLCSHPVLVRYEKFCAQCQSQPTGPCSCSLPQRLVSRSGTRTRTNSETAPAPRPRPAASRVATLAGPYVSYLSAEDWQGGD